LAALRKLNPNLPCGFMSGDTGGYTEESLRGLGAAVVFQKPFRLSELVGQLRLLTSLSCSCGATEGPS
jgi:hypothetical protein